MGKRSLLFFLFFCGITTGYGQKSLERLLDQYNTRSVPYISVEALKQKQLHGEVIVLDARERREYDVSHIPSSLFVGYNTFSSDSVSGLIQDKNATLVVYCSLGIRSEEIGEKLQKAGFMDVYNLYGGIFEWKNTGYEVLDSTEKPTENVHICAKPWGKWLKQGVKVTDNQAQ
ncbi:MAG: rhodanese-like domain-containing protein [Bacteroidota bacterium]